MQRPQSKTHITTAETCNKEVTDATCKKDVVSSASVWEF